MRKILTAPEIRQIILKRLLHWRRHQHHLPMSDPVPNEFGLREAVYAQDAIGWYNVLLGRLSRKWSDVQARYLESIQKRTTGRRWTIAILEKLWDISWDMWEQRNGIAHDPAHPRAIAQLQSKQREVTDIFATGCQYLLPRDQRLFAKGADKITAGTLMEMDQWISSVLLARSRASSINDEYAASLRAERVSFHRWLVSGSEEV
jgi:hypothetical protein